MDDSDSDNEHDLATKRRLPVQNDVQNKQQRLMNAFDRLLDSQQRQIDGEDDRDGQQLDVADDADDAHDVDDADEGDSIDNDTRNRRGRFGTENNEDAENQDPNALNETETRNDDHGETQTAVQELMGLNNSSHNRCSSSRTNSGRNVTGFDSSCNRSGSGFNSGRNGSGRTSCSSSSSSGRNGSGRGSSSSSSGENRNQRSGFGGAVSNNRRN